MLTVENLTKGFGSQLLFEDVNFTLNPKERIGLVGRNGHGKTTLFQLIFGAEQPDTGTITFPKNYHIGFVRQNIAFTKDTVLEEGLKGLPDEESDQQWKVEKVLAGLGFSSIDLQRHPNEFSGGFQVRLNLAKVLVAEPDLLLLDEPTNYLDITSIRWVERFLVNWPHALMLITHDRSFMDKIVTHIMGIHRKKTRKMPGNTSKYYTQIAQEEEIYEKTRMNDERRRKEIQQFITRFRAKARLANLVQSRIKTMDKMEKKEKLDTIQALDFSFRSKPFSGKRVLMARDVSFSYDRKTALIDKFNITIRPRERVCVIGKNGKGKTTLLKLLAGKLTPHHGDITDNPGITKGFFEQTNIKHLVDTRTVEEEMLYAHPDVDQQQARNICGAMMFAKDDALKKIGVLSGGEKSRVMLGKLLVTPANLLLLDEPTHHLDMESCDALLAAIAAFDGTVVMVTHNEMFLQALADRLIVFRDSGAEMFDGGYQRFLEKVGWDDEAAGPKSDIADTGKIKPLKLTKKEKRQRRSEIIAQRAKAVKTIENRIAQLEIDIETGEEELIKLNAVMLEASQSHDGPRIAALSKSIHACRTIIEKRFDELETLTKTYDEHRAEFDKKLEQLEAL